MLYIVIGALINYLFLLPIYGLLQIFIYYHYKKRNIMVSKGYLFGYQAFLFLLITIFTVTDAGTLMDIVNHQPSLNVGHLNLTLYLENILSYECVMNMIMFMPVGIILPLLWKNFQSIKYVLLSGFCLSCLIELSQLLNYRATDINDLLTNTMGTLLGYIIYVLFLKKINFLKCNDSDCSFHHQGLFHILIVFGIYFFIGGALLSLIHSF